MIKNAKFSGYYFYMNLNIWGNFQICFSVPLTSFFSTVSSFFWIFVFSEWVKQIHIICLNPRSISRLEIYNVFLSKMYPVIRSSHQKGFYIKKVFFKISQNWHKNTCTRVSFLIKLLFITHLDDCWHGPKTWRLTFEYSLVILC